MRTTIRSKGVRLGVLAVALCAAVLAAGASAATTVTIGQIDPAANLSGGGDGLVVQTGTASGTSFTVSAGGYVTSWSTYAYGGQMSLVIFRPTGNPNEYTIVGESQPQTLAASSGQLQTFRLTTPIAVQSGDVLGFWVNSSAQASASGVSGGEYDYLLGSEPSVGSVVTMSAGILTGEVVLDISATLVQPPQSKADCMKGGWQTLVDGNGNWFKNQGDCVSYVATGGKNPANGG